MIPRVFVSSTYYDLKHVRERLEKFIDNFGFEPVLFESDKVIYQHGKPIDQSAYYEVGLCHLMVLIIGGRYGSVSSQSDLEAERKKYNEEFISITRKEFETANEKNIPVLIFIEKNVYADYENYISNKAFFDSLQSRSSAMNEFKFAHADDVNIFKFINLVSSKPIKTFDRIEHIESYIKNQLSGMFYLYLESLKKKSDDNKILDAVEELNNMSLRMNEMLNSVGEQILGKNNEGYKKVIKNQLNILIDFFIEKFNENISFVNLINSDLLDTMDVKSMATIIYQKGLKKEYKNPLQETNYNEYKKFLTIQSKTIIEEINVDLAKINSEIMLEKFNGRHLHTIMVEKVFPFINNKNDEQLLIDKIESAVKYQLGDLPF